MSHKSSRVLRVKTVRDLGPQFADNPHEMIGQDGAYSIPLNGESLWFFGDTLVGHRVARESLWYPNGQPVGPCDMSGKGSIKKMLNNSGLILKDRTGRHGFKSYRYVCDDKGNIRPLVPRLPNEHPDQFRIWCLHGCCVGHRVGLFFVKVKMLDSGPFPVNFEVVGSGLATGDKKQLQFKRIPHNGSDLFWNKDEPHFGSAVLVDPDQDWIYVYGVSQDATNVQRCYLARVRPAEIEDKRRYTYFASGQLHWSPLTDRAMSILHGMPNEMSVSHNQHLNCYLAVHSLDLTGRIVGRTAPEPWGPWSEPVTLYTVSVRRQKPLPYPPLIYAGKEHPELCEKGGSTIYVTYIEFEEYFPHLIEIRLE